MESETPRTDAKEWITRVEEDDPELGLKVEDVRVVDADFARQLEPELAAAKAELSKKVEELAAAWMVKDVLLAELAKVRQQRDEARRWLRDACAEIARIETWFYDALTPQQIAAERGWDCYEQGGGA